MAERSRTPWRVGTRFKASDESHESDEGQKGLVLAFVTFVTFVILVTSAFHSPVLGPA